VPFLEYNLAKLGGKIAPTDCPKTRFFKKILAYLRTKFLKKSSKLEFSDSLEAYVLTLCRRQLKNRSP